MKNYWVEIPITGKICVAVDAESKEDAIEKAFELGTLDDLDEWEMHDKIVGGNVFYGVSNEIDVFEQD